MMLYSLYRLSTVLNDVNNFACHSLETGNMPRALFSSIHFQCQHVCAFFFDLLIFQECLTHGLNPQCWSSYIRDFLTVHHCELLSRFKKNYRGYSYISSDLVRLRVIKYGLILLSIETKGFGQPDWQKYWYIMSSLPN